MIICFIFFSCDGRKVTFKLENKESHHRSAANRTIFEYVLRSEWGYCAICSFFVSIVARRCSVFIGLFVILFLSSVKYL